MTRVLGFKTYDTKVGSTNDTIMPQPIEVKDFIESSKMDAHARLLFCKETDVEAIQ